MKPSKIILLFVFVDFLALNLWALFREGLAGMWPAVTHNLWSITLSADLLISLGLVIAWMVRDARARGASSLPYAVRTALTGSVGPLLYLLRRPSTAP